MVDIPMRIGNAVDRNSVTALNHNIQSAKDRSSVLELNRTVLHGVDGSERLDPAGTVHSINASQANTPVQRVVDIQPTTVQKMKIPELKNIVRKGQKTPLENATRLKRIKVCFGWNIKNKACDVDVSAFLLSGKKVLSDDWFVFYGHPESPDGSTIFSNGDDIDREMVTVDFEKINSGVDKIVFVLTINEALKMSLNFSMIQDAYIRIIDSNKNDVLVSFLMDEYYDNVTSMMIGELYMHKGMWKFNAVGNGVARDLAGLCELYGVAVD